jgi:hypothetical protein
LSNRGNTIRVSGRLLWLVVALAVPVCCAAEVKVGSPAPDFTLKDQYEKDFRLSQLKGRNVLLVVGDRKGSQYGGPYWDGVKKNVGSDIQIDAVSVADLRAVPRLLRGWVKGKFLGNESDGKPKNSVVLDWDGVIENQYGFAKEKTNIYLIDRNGILQYRAAGTGTAPEVDELIRQVRGLGTK